jgi:hypothetical protein
VSLALSKRAKGREALFREIAGGRGGARAVLLSETVLGRAQANLEVVAPEAQEEVRRAVELLQLLSEARGPVSRIWKTAHDLRGLAGGFGLDAVGVVAGAIRWYGMDAPADFKPNGELIEALVSMLAHAFRYPDQTPVDTIAKACRDAVTKQLVREGRPAGDGGL